MLRRCDHVGVALCEWEHYGNRELHVRLYVGSISSHQLIGSQASPRGGAQADFEAHCTLYIFYNYLRCTRGSCGVGVLVFPTNCFLAVGQDRDSAIPYVAKTWVVEV